MSEISPHELVDSLSFCVIDLETTGGNPQKDRIIEIGMVKIKNREIIREKSFLINPEVQIPDFIQNLTNISQNDVKDSPIITEVIQEIIEFIGNDIIVAHNTSFDVPFLNGVLNRIKKPQLENKVICTNVMTKHLIPEILNSNLNYMSRLFNIKHSKAHRAHDDALATAQLLLIYLNVFIDKGIKKVNQLYYPRNKFELDRIHFSQQENLGPIVDLLKKTKTPTLLTAKGERGLILAVIPLQQPSEEISFVEEILGDLDWKMVTVRLIKPLIEGIFQFNNHFSKYPEDIRERILNYLNNRYIGEDKNQDNSDTTIEKIDFLISHHLVADQLIVYSFLNLNTNAKPIFKIPAQKKKMYQHLIGQINRFENQQKGRKKHLLHTEIIPLIESYINKYKGQNKHLFLSRKDIKENKEYVFKTIEEFSRIDKNEANFPTDHL